MLKLTDYEQKMLDGEFGRYKQIAMENVVKFAKVLGAEELVPITKVHINMGCPPLNYGISDDLDVYKRQVVKPDMLDKPEELYVKPANLQEYVTHFQ